MGRSRGNGRSAPNPIVRYMILCNDWGRDPNNPRSVNIYGLVSDIRALDEPAFPMLHAELCVFIALTEGRGAGEGQIQCVYEETGQRVFGTPKRKIAFPGDPLEVVGVPFRIRNCLFPKAGLYLVQFWYNDKKVEERPLRLR